MKSSKPRHRTAMISRISILSLCLSVIPLATANGVDLSGNYNCIDGSPYDSLVDDVNQTYYVYEPSPGAGYEVTSGSGCIGHVEIIEGVTSIGIDAFLNAPSITSVTIPNTVTSIGNRAFKDSVGIDSVGITSVVIPDSVVTLGEEVFADVYTLNSVTFGNSLITIGESAFNGTSLTSVTIPNSVTTIDAYAFANTDTILSVSLGTSLTSIGNSSFYNSRISNLVIPDSVTLISEYAFADAETLSAVSLGNSLVTIGVAAFQGSGIQDLLIPDSVTTIGDSAFANSGSLNRVQIGSGVVSLGVSVFDGTNLREHQLLTETQTVYYCGAVSSVQIYDYDLKTSEPSCGDPDAPSLDQVQVLGENSVRLSFTAPTFTGAGVVSQYEVSVRDPSGVTILDTQLFTPSPAIARGASSTLTVVGLTRGTTYAFSLKSIKIANSVEYGSYQSYFLTATTSSPSSSGGTSADELRRQQEAAQAAKQKQDKELKEILSLVPSIAGLSQSIAGLGNSLLLPKKCVKGKLVKNVKAGAKCPKGYKVRK
jgi:hypothetical protein